MKISAQDEYGLRVLLRIARADKNEGITIPQLVEAEGLSQSYVAKLTRTLRIADLIQSSRGQKGGYTLSRPAAEITINHALKALGGTFFDNNFCGSHSGNLNLCTNSVDCSVRSLWKIIKFTLDQVLDRITLNDLLGCETKVSISLKKILEEKLPSISA
ncbi:MAG: Rrf2 family transcriptional regulator [Bacteroidota bacterium]